MKNETKTVFTALRKVGSAVDEAVVLPVGKVGGTVGNTVGKAVVLSVGTVVSLLELIVPIAQLCTWGKEGGVRVGSERG